jgi:hypothetical protein
MATHDATIHDVVLQTIGRIGELEALLEKTDSDSERRSLQAAIAELRQVIRDHAS